MYLQNEKKQTCFSRENINLQSKLDERRVNKSKEAFCEYLFSGRQYPDKVFLERAPPEHNPCDLRCMAHYNFVTTVIPVIEQSHV